MNNLLAENAATFTKTAKKKCNIKKEFNDIKFSKEEQITFKIIEVSKENETLQWKNSVAKMPKSALTRSKSVEIIDTDVVYSSDLGNVRVENLVKDIVLLKVKLQPEDETDIKHLLGKGVWDSENGYKLVPLDPKVFEKNKKQMLNILTRTASQEKENGAYITSLDSSTREAILDEMTGGAISWFKSREGVIGNKEAKFLKELSRLGHQAAPSLESKVHFGTKTHPMMLIGGSVKFSQDEINTISGQLVEHDKCNFNDGGIVGLDQMVSEMFSDLFGRVVSNAESKMLLLQVRASVVNMKAGLKTLPKKVMKRYIKEVSKQFKFISSREYINKLNKGESVEDYWTIIDGTNVTEPHFNCSIVVDGDAAKLVVPTTLGKGDIPLQIMDVAESTNRAKWSGQANNKFLENKEIKNHIIKKAEDRIINSLKKGEDFSNLYTAQFTLNPSKAVTLKRFWMDWVGDIEPIIAKMAKKLDVPVQGSFEVLAADLSNILCGQNILSTRIVDGREYIEVFCPGVNRILPKGRKTGKGFKYPTQGDYETQDFYFLSLNEICDIIETTDLDEETKNVLIEYYKCIGSGTLLFPAINLLKQKLAGLDFDFDAMVVIIEELIADAIVEAVITDIFNK